MSYIAKSVDDLVLAINLANTTAFLPTDLTFGKPQVVAGTWQSNTTLKNTAVRVTAAEGSSYQGTKPVVYDRLDLAALGNSAVLPGLRCSAYQAMTVKDLLPMLVYYTGIAFTVDDLEDTPLVANGDGTQTAVLAAKPDSLGWFGNVTLIIHPGGESLDALVTTTTLPGLNYPTINDSDIFGQLYLYGYDFTPYAPALIAMQPHLLLSSEADALVAMLKAVDISSGKSLWINSSTAAAWNLQGASIISNGLNNATLPTNPAYKYVMVLRLASTVLVPAGDMYLHYNDQFDPYAA